VFYGGLLVFLPLLLESMKESNGVAPRGFGMGTRRSWSTRRNVLVPLVLLQLFFLWR
jgi:hypothetical protein